MSSAVWPGRPYPLGATWDGEGVNFALFSEHAEGVELCLFDPKGTARDRAHRAPRADRPGLALLPARCAARAALRLPRPRSVRAGAGHRFNPQQAPARSVREGDRRAALRWSDAHFGYRVGSKREDLVVRRARQRVRHAASARSSTRRSPGATIAAARRRGTTRSSTSCTSRASPRCIRDVPAQLRGTYAGLATPRR